MAFDVYPSPQIAPLTLAAGATSPLIPFIERANAAVSPDMVIRLVMLGAGCAPPAAAPAPTVFLQANAGDEVEVTASPFLATVFSSPGGLNPVADVSISAEANNVYRVDVYVSTPGSTWKIKIRNNDAVARDFTWVVADSAADSLQPWMHVTPATVTLAAITNQTITQAIQVVNKGTGPLTLTNVAGSLGSGFSVTTIPGTIQPNHCDTVPLSFVTSVPGPVAPVTFTVTGNDTTAQIGGTHNKQSALNATASKVEIGFMLDGSGSMEAAPDGTLGVPLATGSRWAKLKMSTKQCLDLLKFFGEGMGRFAVGVFPDITAAAPTGPTAGDLQAATNITVPAVDNAKNALDAHNPVWAGTPMGKGLERAMGASAAAFGYFESAPASVSANRRLIVLMTDGAHNLNPPPPSAFYPGVAAPGTSFTDKKVRCLTVGYGDPSSPTAWEVDHALLNEIAEKSLGQYHFSGASNDGLDLPKAFRAILTQGLTLNPIVDPPVTVTAGAPDFRREVTILPYDTKVSFVVNWATDARPVSMTLITPLCEVITAASMPVGSVLNTHPRYTIMSFRWDFLRNAANPSMPRFGTWKLIVSVPGLAGSELVDYEVITESRLRLKVTADRTRFYAGDTYRLDAALTLDGLPVRNANVVLRMRRPGESVDRIVAETLVTEREYAQVEQQFAGRELSRRGLKIAALQNKGIVLGGFYQPSSTPMTDPDGDGIYSATIPDTRTVGAYEFYVVATGVTAEGIPFRREQRMQAMVEARPDPGYTWVEVQFLRQVDIVFATVTVYPKDPFGNPVVVSTGSDSTLQFSAKDAEFTGPIVDRGDGGYSRTIKYKAKATPAVQVRVGDIEIVPKLQPARVASLEYADKVVEFRRGGEAERGMNKHAVAKAVLGDITVKKPEQFLALGARGSVTVSFGGKPIRGSGREDVTVFTRSGEDLRPYRVEALGAREKWVTLGTSPGVTQSFSLAKGKLKTTTMIRITDESGRTKNTDTTASEAPGVNISGVGVTTTSATPVTPSRLGGRTTPAGPAARRPARRKVR